MAWSNQLALIKNDNFNRSSATDWWVTPILIFQKIFRGFDWDHVEISHTETDQNQLKNLSLLAAEDLLIHWSKIQQYLSIDLSFSNRFVH